ncbi:MAG: hypothetical protein ACXAEF_00185 [Candidatus Thorarchaeota archaeon]|jgi:hypothetical protein
MPVKIKDATINSIEDTETKKLKILKMVSKTEGASLTIELPDALCDPFAVKDIVAVSIGSEELTRGEKSKLYAEGTVFKMNESDGLEVVGTIGGLRFVLNLSSPKPAQRKTFDSEKFFLSLD